MKKYFILIIVIVSILSLNGCLQQKQKNDVKKQPTLERIEKTSPSGPVVLFLEAWKNGRKKRAHYIMYGSIINYGRRRIKEYSIGYRTFLEVANRDLDSFDNFKIKKIRKHPKLGKYMGYDVIVSLYVKGKLFNSELFQVNQNTPGKYSVFNMIPESSQ